MVLKIGRLYSFRGWGLSSQDISLFPFSDCSLMEKRPQHLPENTACYKHCHSLWHILRLEKILQGEGGDREYSRILLLVFQNDKFFNVKRQLSKKNFKKIKKKRQLSKEHDQFR